MSDADMIMPVVSRDDDMGIGLSLVLAQTTNASFPLEASMAIPSVNQFVKQGFAVGLIVGDLLGAFIGPEDGSSVGTMVGGLVTPSGSGARVGDIVGTWLG